MKLGGPDTDAFGVEVRVQTDAAGVTTVDVASHFQDIFGHVYRRWSHFSASGQLLAVDDYSTSELVLKAGDIDKSDLTDDNDIMAVYAKVQELLDAAGVSGQKHAEDLNDDDLVDAADLLKVLEAITAPPPFPPALTALNVYNVAPRHRLRDCYCGAVNCCTATSYCGCVTIYPPSTHKGGLGPLDTWWSPSSQPAGSPPLPPGVYPDRRINPDPLVEPGPCDGFRILPGDIEPGGILLPARFNRSTDTVTALIEDPSIAQFSCDEEGHPLPREPGGDINLRVTLTNEQINKAGGKLKVYGLEPGQTRIKVTLNMRNSSGAMQTAHLYQYVKVGGKIEMGLRGSRRWQAPAGWWEDRKAAYYGAMTQLPQPDFLPGGPNMSPVPTALPPMNAQGGRIGLNPHEGEQAQAQLTSPEDRIIITDACGEEIERPTQIFTKRMFIGGDYDGDGICDTFTKGEMSSASLNPPRITEAIANREGPLRPAGREEHGRPGIPGGGEPGLRGDVHGGRARRRAGRVPEDPSAGRDAQRVQRSAGVLLPDHSWRRHRSHGRARHRAGADRCLAGAI